LWGRALINSDADQNFAKQREDAGDVVETRYYRCLAMGLSLDAVDSDTIARTRSVWKTVFPSRVYILLVVDFFREVKGAVFVAQADRAAKQDAHTFVRTE
jgi:hypothetical protein